MTSDRAYRKALSRDRALEEITTGAGIQFCPISAGALLDILNEREAAPSRTASSAC
jgi:HD-GYP domain-containing protein (c-di-GMP phosphodiesterase class II)